MSDAFLLSLGVVVAVVLAARLLLFDRLLDARVAHLSWFDVVVAALGLLGLGVHCGAMFFRSEMQAVSASDGMVGQIDALGGVSIAWFVVSAVLVVFGLRHVARIILVAEAVALTAVGVTMYDGGPLRVHLAAIFVTVVLLTAIVSLTLPPTAHVRPARS